MAKGDPKNSGAYGAQDIGNYAGGQSQQGFQSMYPNLNMPNAVSSGQRVGDPNMYQQPQMGIRGGGGMQGGMPQQQQGSMMPSQGQMPNFLQMAMQRYQGNQANQGMPMQPSMQPQMSTPGQGIDESVGGGMMQPSPEMLQQLLAQRGGGGGFNPGRAQAGNRNPLMPQ